MPALLRLLSIVGVALGSVLLGLLIPRVAGGQTCITCDQTPPSVAITPTGGAFVDSSLTVTIEWCDNIRLDGHPKILLNGANVRALFSYVTGTRSGCTDYARSTGTVILKLGGNTLKASIGDPNGNKGSRTASYTYATYGVEVTPKGDPVAVAAQSSATQRFFVRNTGTVGVTYELSLTCTGTATGCTAPASMTIAAGRIDSVDVSYRTGTSGTTGLVRLTAIQRNPMLVQDVGFVNVSAAGLSPKAPIVLVDSVNAGTTIERSLCLTIAAGSDAAYECGDLRLAHALPTTRTLGKARTPTLIYSSQHARPYPLVAANITLDASTTVPDSVTARLLIGGAVPPGGTGKWPGSDWLPNSTRRIVVGFDASAYPTGVTSYRLEVTNWYPGGLRSASASGELVVINRQNTYFGAGWWLAGLEELHLATMLWVGGDGSTRVYRLVRTTPDSAWATPNVDQPDTLKKVGTQYVRYLPHGVQVRFNTQGRHVATVDRLGHQTTFAYTSGRLTSITLPPAGSGLTYTFVYPTTAPVVLDSVIAPPADARHRATKLTRNARRITAIRDADPTLFVSFAYESAFARIRTRTDRRGTTTTYTFGAGEKLSLVSVNMGTGQPSIVTNFLAAESRGLPGTGTPSALRLDSVYAVLDGPRIDVGDTTRFWLVDRFGAPRKIKDALGHETELARRDPRWPALVTRVEYPNNRVVSASYDGRGNTLTTIDSSRFSGSSPRRFATTRYEWDPKWDFLTKIVPPEQDSVIFAYDLATGNRLWQQDARGDSTRVTFQYNGLGLLSSFKTPRSTRPHTLAYDALGNLAQTTTPLGFSTRYRKDRLGRDTSIVSPISGSDTLIQRIVYDIMDRDTLSLAIGGPLPYRDRSHHTLHTPAETRRVRKSFDPEGNLLSQSSRSEPDLNNVGTITSRWSYDRANRAVKAVAPDLAADSTLYDPAGNPTEQHTRRRHVIRMAYDPLNRLTRRITPEILIADSTIADFGTNDRWTFPLYRGGSASIIPADTATFAYDAIGNLTTANNGDAQISRTHNQDGTIASDELRIRTTVLLGGVRDFSRHIYRLQYVYDLNGRRTQLVHPDALAPRLGSAVMKTAHYRYTSAGQLQSVTDVLGNSFLYGYDAEGRLNRLDFPGGITEARYYDDDGRMWRRSERATNPFVGSDSGFATGTLHEDTLTYDARDKIVRVATKTDSITNVYSALGTLVRSYARNRALHSQFTDEQFITDALGNQRRLQFEGIGSSQAVVAGDDSTYFFYQPGTGRLWHAASPTRLDSTTYDAAGNKRAFAARTVPDQFQERTVFYYGADQKLRMVDRRTCMFRLLDGAIRCDRKREPGFARRGVFENYRYDALGRRIWLRSRSDSSCVNLCVHVIERTVWDGDQVLYEIRMPGGDNITASELERDTTFIDTTSVAFYGRVAYTHGVGIDRPLNVIRMGYARGFADPIMVVPHANWRGLFDLSSFANGTRKRYNSTRTDTVRVTYPAAAHWGMFYRNRDQDVFGPLTWFGHLIEEKRDATGQLYMRNRYYDPQSGRFTQEDPIGLAGGMNLYGFAEGDPVNYSDPFGLCPVCVPAGAGALGGAAVGALGTLAWNYYHDQPLSSDLARNTLLGAGVGAAFGLGTASLGAASAALAPSIPKLSPDLAATFEAGRYAGTRLAADMRVYRVFDGENASKVGRWFTTTAQSSSGAAQKALQLYNNSATRMVSAVIPRGTVVYTGQVAGSPTSATQIFVPNAARVVKVGVETALPR